ncbi:hypothetical protein C7S15_9020 (plasmid) [Burkholderia cepacia]|nr:hypothetical protein [Burkholderia cepacia]
MIRLTIALAPRGTSVGAPSMKQGGLIGMNGSGAGGGRR